MPLKNKICQIEGKQYIHIYFEVTVRIIFQYINRKNTKQYKLKYKSSKCKSIRRKQSIRNIVLDILFSPTKRSVRIANDSLTVCYASNKQSGNVIL